MVSFPWPFKRKKEQMALVLDIGNEAAKAVLLKNEDEKTQILGKTLKYFDDYGFFDTLEFNREPVRKAAAAAASELSPELNRKLQNIIIGLPPNLLKAKLAVQIFERDGAGKIIDEAEEKAFYQKAVAEAKLKLSETYRQYSGILPDDIQFTNLKILEMKIDGYPVKELKGYDGRKLYFKILGVFLKKYLIKEMAGIIPQKAKVNIVHEVGGLFTHFSQHREGIFLDAGGKTTSVFLVKNGAPEGVGEFLGGGKIFSQEISEKLGLREKDARILKEKYAKKELSAESAQRIKEMLYFPSRAWFKDLKHKLKEMAETALLPSKIHLFGGGSMLPDIKEILENGDWGELAFPARPQIEVLSNPQYVPALLIISAIYAQKGY